MSNIHFKTKKSSASFCFLVYCGWSHIKITTNCHIHNSNLIRTGMDVNNNHSNM